jgi:hypothetical protein
MITIDVLQYQLNLKLAELLGWTNISQTNGALLGKPPPGHYCVRDQALIPNWTNDWQHCGPLIVQYQLYSTWTLPWSSINELVNEVFIQGNPYCFSDNKQLQSLLRCSYVAGTIYKLENHAISSFINKEKTCEDSRPLLSVAQ